MTTPFYLWDIHTGTTDAIIEELRHDHAHLMTVNLPHIAERPCDSECDYHSLAFRALTIVYRERLEGCLTYLR